jgi:hypothetical protein
MDRIAKPSVDSLGFLLIRQSLGFRLLSLAFEVAAFVAFVLSRLCAYFGLFSIYPIYRTRAG